MGRASGSSAESGGEICCLSTRAVVAGSVARACVYMEG